MISATVRAPGPQTLHVRAFPKDRGRADHYFTAAAPPGLSAGEASRRVYGELCAAVSETGLAPVQEKVYGLLRERTAVLKAREAMFQTHGLDASLPVSYLEGRPVSGGGFAGVQMWAVRGKVETVRHPWGLGRLWSEGGSRFLYLPGVTGAAPDGPLPPGRAGQARRMFLNARSALRLHGFEFSHVVRTWIYLRRILEWYGGFNQVRNAIYRSPDFFGPSFQDRAPASTGIGGASRRGDCVMDVLALRPESRGGAAVERIRSSARQGPAPRYGSAFARATVLCDGPSRTIHVSGTASIDGSGKSVGPGDCERQCLQTLLNVAAILEERGAGLGDICSAALFCKDRRSYDAFLRVSRLLRLPPLPVIALLADVCRPELRVEIEAVAVRINPSEPKRPS